MQERLHSLHLTSIQELLSMLRKYSGRETVQWEEGAEPTQDSAANKTPPTESGTEHTFMTGEFLSIHRFHGNIIEKWTEKKKFKQTKINFLHIYRGMKKSMDVAQL